jgi:hypothetical protein
MTWTAPAYPRVDEPFDGTERATSDGLPAGTGHRALRRAARVTEAAAASVAKLVRLNCPAGGR